MSTRRFIFSLDAFVAFTLALIAIYSLIFFSSVPSAYYYMLTQAHYLARDTLMTVSTSACVTGACDYSGSVLDNIAFETNLAKRKELIAGTVGPMIPSQFGYVVSISDGAGQPFVPLYDTGVDPDLQHARSSRKLNVSTQVMVFGYTGTVNKLVSSPYAYGDRCSAGSEGGAGEGVEGSDSAYSGTLITCGNKSIDNGDGTFTDTPLGNVRPNDVMGGDAVPESEAKIVKLTIFI